MSGPPPGWLPPPGPPAGPGHPRSDWLLLGVGGGGVAAVVAIVLVVLLVVPTASVPPPAVRQDTSGGTQLGSGQLVHCGAGFPTTDSSWICLNASVGSLGGSARGWYQFQTDFNLTSLSGRHSYTGIGALNLAAGFASVGGSCAPGQSGFARVYVFWHVWVYDNTVQTYLDQQNSGYLWDSGPVNCPGGGGPLPVVGSPALVGPASSFMSGGFPLDLFVAGHSYRFTFFLGCTGQVSLTGPAASGGLAAGCNLNAPAPSSNTFVETGIAIH